MGVGWIEPAKRVRAELRSDGSRPSNPVVIYFPQARAGARICKETLKCGFQERAVEEIGFLLSFGLWSLTVLPYSIEDSKPMIAIVSISPNIGMS